MSDTAMPEIIFYAETGGKTAPFYQTLGGIRSAFKTTWMARQNRWAREAGRPERYPVPQVFRGEVTWTEIDVETGLPLLAATYSDLDIGRHLVGWHVDLIVGHDRQETHTLAHGQTLDHVHGKVS